MWIGQDSDGCQGNGAGKSIQAAPVVQELPVVLYLQ